MKRIYAEPPDELMGEIAKATHIEPEKLSCHKLKELNYEKCK